MPGTTSAHEPTIPITTSKRYPHHFRANKSTSPASGKKERDAATANADTPATICHGEGLPFTLSVIEGSPPNAKPTNSVTVGIG